MRQLRPASACFRPGGNDRPHSLRGKENIMRDNTKRENIMGKTKIWITFLSAALLVSATARVHAQTEPGKIHGHVQDPAGTPLKGGTVILSTDNGKTAKYTFTTDDNGDYKGDGIAPGTYTFIYRNPDTPPDK